MGDSTAELPGMFTLVYIETLFNRAKSFVECHRAPPVACIAYKRGLA